MSSLIGNIWAKSPAPKSVNGDKGSRGIKRKAKSDPYDDLDDDDSTQKTPSGQRMRPHISSEAPSSGTKGRPSSASKTNKHRGRSSGAKKVDAADSPRVDAVANLARAQDPQAARLHPRPQEESTKDSLVSATSVSDMGASDPANNAIATPSHPAADEPEPADKTTVGDDAKGKGKGKDKQTGVGQAEQKQPEVDERDEQEIQALLKHRMAQDGRVELLVHWVGESEEEATWELEEEIQKGAADMLYTYWKSQGGRINALFIKPKDAPPETYHVFKILGHEKKQRGGFELEVQWVGHSTAPGETSVEAEAKVKKIAPAILEQYWNDAGGRENFLVRRGRNKKPRTE